MSVIQKIRDKYARVSVIAIAVALLGFILTDYISGRSRGLFSGGGNSNIVGRVNGKKIEPADFDKKVKQQEEYLQKQPYSQGPDANRQQAIEGVWNQEVNQILTNSEVSKLGLQVGKREINDMLFGPNPHEYAKQYLGDPNTGQYDPARAQQIISQIKKSKDQAQKDQLNSLLNAMEEARLSEKFTSLITNTINFPRWYLEKQNTDNSQIAKISLVRVPYSNISDSSIKISDKEIEDYISNHKNDYKQEESRSISYVTFSALPTQADTAAIKSRVETIKKEFDTTHDAAAFLIHNDVSNFFDGYIAKSQMQMGAKDSIQRLSKNEVFGSYIDGGNYVLAKMLDIKELPDSVKCRHVLVSTNVQQGGYDDSVAHKKIDSIKNAISSGASWAAMVEKYNPPSDGSRQQKGEMTFSSA